MEHLFTFPHFLSVFKTWSVSFVGRIYRSCFVSIQPFFVFWLEHLISLHLWWLLIYIYIYIIISILLIGGCFCRFFFLSSFVLMIWMMTILSAMFWVLSLFCVSFIDFLVCGYHEVERAVCVCMIVFDCCSLNFKYIWKTLHLYSLPLTVTVF